MMLINFRSGIYIHIYTHIYIRHDIRWFFIKSFNGKSSVRAGLVLLQALYYDPGQRTC